jgi:hypothetical protein
VSPSPIDITLEPGAVSEQVMVSDTGAQVQTAEASLGQVLDTKPIESCRSTGAIPALDGADARRFGTRIAGHQQLGNGDVLGQRRPRPRRLHHARWCGS